MILLRLLLPAALLVVYCHAAFAQQKRVAITIDDIPRNGRVADFSDEVRMNRMLLEHITEAGTPVTAFFTPTSSLQTGETLQRLELLRSWIEHPLVTLGNHTYKHLNHSRTSLDSFIEDVSIGGYVIRSLAGDKPMKYFRFPFNALGADSADQARKKAYLNERGYILTPFTIESSDYAYNAVFAHELLRGNRLRADSIAQTYIEYTILTFKEAEAFVQELHERPIDHIFLCHDNLLHAHCYPQLIKRLREIGYSFISLDEAMKDPIYQTSSYYHGKYGISWIYRWIQNSDTRKAYMKRASDPDMNLYREYQQLSNAK